MSPRDHALGLIAAALAAPITHKVVTTYADGATRELGTRCAKSAENYAVGERRKIGRNLISRNPDLTAGPIVRVVSVEIIPVTASA